MNYILKKTIKKLYFYGFFIHNIYVRGKELWFPYFYLGSAQDASEACSDGGVLDSAHPAGLINNRSDICRVCDSYGLQRQKSLPYHS